MKLRIAGIVITVVAASLWIGTCLALGTDNSPSCSSSPDTVRYEVSGTAESVDISLSNAMGGFEQYKNVRLPYSVSYSDYRDDFVYISAQNNGDSGTVNVAIYVNGKLFKSSSSYGAYAIADASGGK